MPLAWRLQKEHAGSGALGDIGAHIIDMTQFVTGLGVERRVGHDRHDRQASARCRARVRACRAPARRGLRRGHRRRRRASSPGGCRTARSSSFEATRFATGRKNALTIEVSGDKGALASTSKTSTACGSTTAPPRSDRQGFTQILVTEPQHPYVVGVVARRPHARLRARLQPPGRGPRGGDRRGRRPPPLVRRGAVGAARARGRRASSSANESAWVRVGADVPASV